MESTQYLIWNTDPEIIRIGPLALRWYTSFFILSFLSGLAIMKRIFLHEGKPLTSLDSLLTHTVIGMLIGARLGHCLFYEPAYYLSHPLEILMVWHGGLASHGAAVGILIALYLYARKWRPEQPYLWVVDRVVIVVALAGCFVRLGNFFNSEILGLPTDLPWAIIFARVDNIPRHPVQLYEAFAYLLIFMALHFKYKKRDGAIPQGLLLGWFLIFIFGYRLFAEVFKERQAAYGADSMLTVGQWLSIPAVLTGVYLVWRARKERNICE